MPEDYAKLLEAMIKLKAIITAINQNGADAYLNKPLKVWSLAVARRAMEVAATIPD